MVKQEQVCAGLKTKSEEGLKSKLAVVEQEVLKVRTPVTSREGTPTADLSMCCRCTFCYLALLL